MSDLIPVQPSACVLPLLLDGQGSLSFDDFLTKGPSTAAEWTVTCAVPPSLLRSAVCQQHPGVSGACGTEIGQRPLQPTLLLQCLEPELVGFLGAQRASSPVLSHFSRTPSEQHLTPASLVSALVPAAPDVLPGQKDPRDDARLVKWLQVSCHIRKELEEMIKLQECKI